MNTLNCVICHQKADFFTGHVLLSHKQITAGFCKEHLRSSDQVGACFGVWKAEYGLKQIYFYKEEKEAIENDEPKYPVDPFVPWVMRRRFFADIGFEPNFGYDPAIMNRIYENTAEVKSVAFGLDYLTKKLLIRVFYLEGEPVQISFPIKDLGDLGYPGLKADGALIDELKVVGKTAVADADNRGYFRAMSVGEFDEASRVRHLLSDFLDWLIENPERFMPNKPSSMLADEFLKGRRK